MAGGKSKRPESTGQLRSSEEQGGWAEWLTRGHVAESLEGQGEESVLNQLQQWEGCG